METSKHLFASMATCRCSSYRAKIFACNWPWAVVDKNSGKYQVTNVLFLVFMDFFLMLQVTNGPLRLIPSFIIADWQIRFFIFMRIYVNFLFRSNNCFELE